ncbi:MAG: HNH endonuclease, partial [Armatimonadetes bacterium]|nr:HNH endonuclease [Anaerolineae bacterium]
MSRVHNITTWAKRLGRLTPLTSVSIGLVKFNTQAMQNPEISDVEYQQGELIGYEVREYLLEKWGRKCVYCGAKDTPMEVEHIIPKSRGGSSRVSNLTLACRSCNQQKGNLTAAEFAHPYIQAQAKLPLKDAATMNATRWKLYGVFAQANIPLEVGTGGRTKFNRIKQTYPKTHWLDAACVGESGAQVFVSPHHVPLLIKATGHGSRQMCRTDKYGFPSRYRLRQKRHFGFQTGDMVQAIVLTGKKVGTYIGRVACRATGSFNITTLDGIVQGISYKYCAILHKSDGYTYAEGARCLPPYA